MDETEIGELAEMIMQGIRHAEHAASRSLRGTMSNIPPTQAVDFEPFTDALGYVHRMPNGRGIVLRSIIKDCSAKRPEHVKEYCASRDSAARFISTRTLRTLKEGLETQRRHPGR